MIELLNFKVNISIVHLVNNELNFSQEFNYGLRIYD